MTESVRLSWVRSMHKCATVHAAMQHLTGMDSSGEAQHVDMTKSRSRRDFKDSMKIIEWFAANNPFDEDDARLRCIASGLVASDNINCDEVEKLGAGIMTGMDGKTFTVVVMKRADNVLTFAHMSKKIKVGGDDIRMDSNILFDRLLLIAERSSDLELNFKYELTVMPMALFKDSSMRKTNKSELAKEITKKTETLVEVPATEMHVIDGGCLLHRVKWNQNATYRNIAEQYVNYVKRHYNYGDESKNRKANCLIVFDGYGNGPTIKDHEHHRRATKSAPDIKLEETKVAHADQSAFLKNENNKKGLVTLLMQCFNEVGFAVKEADNDADTVIVSSALDMARKMHSVTVVADDTDVLVLLVSHFQPDMAEIFMLSEITRSRTARSNVTSVRAVQESIGEKAAKQLIVIHALSGCDTTSALFGHGKGNVYRKILKSSETVALTDIIGCTTASHKEVEVAGMKMLALVYGAKDDETLNHLRYVTYMNMLAKSSRRPHPERLPPTERAAYFHLLRVHLQAVQWQSLMTVQLDPMEWGWKLKEGQLSPVATDQAIAPAEVLKVIRCQCQTTTQHPCRSNQCSCRKHGLQCVPACQNCYGETCENAAKMEPILLADSAEDNDVDNEVGKDEGLMDDINTEVDNEDETDNGIVDDVDIDWLHDEVIEAL